MGIRAGLESLDYNVITVGKHAPKSTRNKQGGFEQNCYQEIKQSQFGSFSRSGRPAADPG